MKPKVYNLLSLAIEEGIAHGYQRAFKHNDSPQEQEILNTIHIEVMNALCEYFDF